MELGEITIKSASNHTADMLTGISKFYNDQVFCDATVICSNGVAIKCHKLVLAAMSDMVARAMEDKEDEELVVLMPDLDSSTMTRGLDAVYNCKSSTKFDLKKQRAIEMMCEALHSSHQHVLNDSCQTKIEEEEEDEKYSNHVNANTQPVKKAARKRKSSLDKSYYTGFKVKVKKVSNVKSEEDPVHILDHLAHLDKMMEEKQGTWIVKVESSKDDLASSGVIPKFSPTNLRYMALMGVRRPERDVHATPLAWSCPELLSDSAIVRQLKAYGSSVKSVFGMSDMEIFGQVNVRQLMAIPKQNVSRSYLIRKSHAKLKDSLNDAEVQAAAQQGSPKDTLKMYFDGMSDEVALNIVDEISSDEIDGIMLVLVHSNEVATAKILNPCLGSDWPQFERDDACKELFKLFFKIFLFRTKENCYEGCKQLMDLHLHYLRLKKRHEMAMEILNGKDVSYMEPTTEMCEDCGKTFEIRNQTSKGYFVKHKRDHYFENYKCDCEVTWTCLKTKRRHVKLVHMEGYVKCEYCNYVASEITMDWHVNTLHTKMTCEYCGAVLSNKRILEEHIVRLHPEKASKKALNRKTYDGTCHQCGMHYKDLRKHMQMQHQGGNSSVTCNICGKDYKKKTIKKHILCAHTPESELPYSCNLCTRR